MRVFLKSVLPTLLTVLITASLPVAVPAAMAQENIVVTGTRIPTPIDRFAGAATVITSDDIDLYGYRSLADMLAGVPGLHVAPSGGVGAQTSVFMRGAGSNHVLVLIDGIEVTDPASGGLFGFEHLQLNGVERVEVLRGPYSAQYGSDGIGGVINIVTRRGGGEPEAAARVGIGSFATDTAAVNLSGRHGIFDFSISGARLRTDGESFTPRRLRGGQGGERDGYDNFDMKGTVGVQVGDLSRLDFNFGYVDAGADYDQDMDLDGDFLPDLFETTPKNSVREKRYSLRWSGEYLQGIWRPSLRGAYYSRQSRNPGAERRGGRTQFEWRNVLSLSDVAGFVVGVETELEKARGVSVRDASRNNAVYLQAWFEPFDSLSLSGGWRNDDPDDFGSDRNWQVSAAFDPGGSGVRLRASYGTAFKAPTLDERFGLGGNPDLGPETSRSWEAGVGQAVSGGSVLSRSGWGVAYFDNRIRNLIAASFYGDPPGEDGRGALFRNENISSAHIEGIESFAFLETAGGFGLRLDHTIMRAYNGDHRRLLRRPLRKAALEAHWMDPVWSVVVKLDYVGPQREIRRNDFSLVTKGGYTLVNVSARRWLNHGFALFARINNAFDKGYEPVDGFAGRGVEFHAGVEISL